ncbi:hypothetical protein ACK8P5_24775 [Paenibacillus sp. EC2-1]|uniref:hypothetical protein n=1 Tax=Paenibacillus sp. EC2-1 TaxID=3388665 RepID=UPI003BEF495C
MHAITQLLRSDVRQISRDPMLLSALLAPVLLILFLRLGIPMASNVVYERLGIELTLYYREIMSFFLLLTPLILGMLSGFVILDERDENLISYYAVTPLSRRGYFLYRLSVPIVISTCFSLLLIYTVQLVYIPWTKLLLLMPMIAMEAPIVALFMSAFAANKVEGLALSKLAGLVVLAPLIIFWVPSPWQWLGGIIPTFWISKTYLIATQQGSLNFMLYVIIGTVVHLIFLKSLLRLFVNKLD